ncbi:hypothetical protein NPIL_521461 [Nephila pilipes]|uniref:Reverse transcriptase domain-containing protein n=1 Tax=Nephila pilipes TaxID=299642 RepID=A0A8X6PFH8_NEPPI|nr:hypothetical protein NPIL_521461 [Nephila pilipes]
MILSGLDFLLCYLDDILIASPDDDAQFLRHLQITIRDLKSLLTTTHGRKSVFGVSELSSCSHIFIFNNAATSSLKTAFLGPYAFEHRKKKLFDVAVEGLIKRISIDHLQSAFFFKGEAENLKSTVDTESKNVYEIKSGRHVKLPDHLKDYI